MKNKFTYIFILVILVLMAVYCSQIIKFNSDKYNKAIDGKIDLNADYLNSVDYISLGGEWQFYPNVFLSLDEIKKTDKAALNVRLPGSWIDRSGEEGRRGYGTYCLEFNNVIPETELSFLFAIAPSEAYDVYIDSDRIFGVGQIGETKETVEPEYKSFAVDTKISDGSLMIMHVSDVYYHSGGFVRPITAGYRQNIDRLKLNILIKDVLILGSLTLLLLIILIMAFINKRNRLTLIYLLLANLISICYVLSTGDIIIQTIFPNIPFFIHYTMYYLISICGGTLLILFIRNLYPELINKTVSSLSLVKAGVLFFLFFTFKGRFVGAISNVKDILALVEFIYCIAFLIIGITQKKKNALLMLIGVFALFMSVLWDMMYAYSMIFTSLEFIMPYGLVVLSLCSVVSIIKEYQSVYMDALEYQNLKLKLNEQKAEKGEKLYNIKLFGAFEVYRNDGTRVHFRTQKTKELMAYLVHHKNQEMDSDTIINDLWPDKPLDKAKGILYTTFYYLRKEMNAAEQTVFDKRYLLKEKFYHSDYDVFLKQSEALYDSSDGKISEENMTFFEAIILLYNDGYFEKDHYLWANEKRIEIENKVMAYAYQALKVYDGKSDTVKEIALCERMIAIDGFQENLYQRLLAAYLKIGNQKRFEEARVKYESALKELN